jgi:hypothetical protein
MGVILMAMTIGGSTIAAILLTIAFWKKIGWLKTFVLGGVTVWFVFYGLIFFLAAVFSEEKTLSLNQTKSFCGFYFDCHMQTAVTDVRKTKNFGGRTANGEFYVVRIKVSSDAKKMPLNLLTPDFEVVDAGGDRYQRLADLEKPAPDWQQKVPAGGSFEKEIVFDLPPNVVNPRLDIREGYGIDHAIEAILVGDEDSLGHRRNYFKLEEPTQTAGVK